jgi:predicted DNA-binding transcriptional regulator YafY
MSYRVDLTERLITIPFKLAGRPHSRRELAITFGVDPKTISNDINALTRFHPIELRRDGREVYYGFSDGYKFSVPNFAPEELATLLFAQLDVCFSETKQCLHKLFTCLFVDIQIYIEVFASAALFTFR